jgi:hypothetical protein
MHELEISSIEKLTIIAVDEGGAQYRVEVDETSLARLKRSATASTAQRVSPKEIQSLLRSGLSNDEVMALTGASPEQIERYATPVLAEREYVVTTSQTLPAFGHVETSHDAITFGELVAERLELAEARNREWTAWKSEDGKWMLKLKFSAAGVERDARWIFDGKRSTVIPANTEAERLSAAGSFEVPTMPALRVVPDHMTVDHLPSPTPEETIVELNTPGSTTPLLIDTETNAVVTNIDSEDLLEALRRRRNASDDAPAWLREDVASRTAPVDALFQDSLDIDLDDTTEVSSLPNSPVFPLSATGGHKRNRPTMPKWDDIVSETKSDDDLI